MNYMTLIEIADLLAELLDFDSVTAGSIVASLDKTIGVYQREPFVPRECIGGDSSYQTSKLRILVHWTDSIPNDICSLTLVTSFILFNR